MCCLTTDARDEAPSQACSERCKFLFPCLKASVDTLVKLHMTTIEKYGFPSDLSLSPREMIQLYDTMSQFWEGWPRAQELCPEEFIHFKNKIVITKMDTRKYEESLKAELTGWVKSGHA
ncbi:putative ATP-dependent RNA helicase DDX60 [Camelus dromedarius]|uniref:Putative ATP-dependent RNA helicase DDX60 n=1 Tax=Camelus dromedarius TaxID=9838 RepID=A0A5N4CV49_CAMDR|nr:putative ATP-dependent RNA helicase DDX60 [Camelus dromedarius]